MKREFLQNLKVGVERLPKDVIDAILDENSRDIGEAKKPFADYAAVKAELDAAKQTIQTLRGDEQALDAALDAAKQWEKRYNEAQEQHQAECQRLRFDHALERAIVAAKGRSVKAIAALLDIDALGASDDPTAAIGQAVEALKKENGYLFEADRLPPLYARGTGAQMGAEEPAPANLAEALKERFEKERK